MSFRNETTAATQDTKSSEASHGPELSQDSQASKTDSDLVHPVDDEKVRAITEWAVELRKLAANDHNSIYAEASRGIDCLLSSLAGERERIKELEGRLK